MIPRAVSPRVRLDAESTSIRPYAAHDLEDLLALRRLNRDYLEPYEAARDSRFYTSDGQARELRFDREAWTSGTGYGFAVLDTSDDADRLVGRVALANVVRGSWGNATLGYWISKEDGGRGHATAAVLLALRFAFEHLGLHRVQPAVMPRNARSLRVVEKCGFRYEGRAQRYLQINGVWEDHEIFALTAEEWEERADA